MRVDQKIAGRLQQLIDVGEQVLRTKSAMTEEGTSYLGDYAVNYARLSRAERRPMERSNASPRRPSSIRAPATARGGHICSA